MEVNGSQTAWGLDIREAGPPATLAFYSGWLSATALAYLLFTVIRPLAVDTDRSASVSARRPSKSLWFPSQLFFMTWAWCALDCVHRTFCYVLLSPTMLWRRALLPLASRWTGGFWSSWVNQLRFVVHCRGVHPRGAADFSTTACRQYQLPVGLPPSEDVRARAFSDVVPPFASEQERMAESHQYHLVALYSVLTTVALVIAVTNEARRLRRLRQTWRPWRPGQAPSTAEAEQETKETPDSAGTPSATQSTFKTAHSKFYVKGADDAWLNSAEAEAEYARWEQAEATPTTAEDAAALTSPAGQMHQVLLDTWPTLLATAYGGLYAATGAMPLLGLLLFPAVSIVAIGSALYCSLD